MTLFNQPFEEEIDLSNIDIENPQTEPQTLPDEVEVPDTTVEAPVTEPEDTPEVDTTVEPEGTPEEPSSLTSEPEAQEPVPPATLELGDDQVLTYLSEKLGREVTSLEDLAPAESPVDPFEGDTELQAIAEWKKKTGRPIGDWSKYQRDFDSMSNADVVREHLQLQYPDFTAEEIALEMEDYVADPDSDLDSDVAKKNLRLKKAALTARQELNQYKSTFDTPATVNLTAEQKEAISFYQKYQEQSQQSQNVVKEYEAGITAQASTIKSVPLQLADDFSIDLTISEDEAKSLPKMIRETPQWLNEDGSYNHAAVVRDAIKMKHFDKAVKMAYEQGVSKGREFDDSEGRNIDFGNRQVAPVETNEIIVEGADSFSKELKFGRKR